MGHVAHFKGGQHLFLCHVCGFTFHSEKKKIMWDGTITCGRKGCYPSVENASPEPADVFISTAITADDL